MNLGRDSKLVTDLLHRQPDPALCWEELCSSRRKLFSRASSAALASLDIEQDAVDIARQLRAMIRQNPVAPKVDGFWFGLFDAVDESGKEFAGYYVSGMRGFDKLGERVLQEFVWSPEERYLDSKVLNTIKSLDLKARQADDDDAADVLSYTMMLGCAAIVSRSAMMRLKRTEMVVVGFDSGDMVRVS